MFTSSQLLSRPQVSFAVSLVAASAALSQPVIRTIPKLTNGTYIYPYTISDDGLVVVGDADTAGSNRAFRWTQQTGTQSLSVVPGNSSSAANACSGDGLTVVGVSGTSYDIAAKWTQGTGMTSLGALAPGQPSFAWDTSDNASVIIGFGYLGGGLQRGWKWTSTNGMQAFTTLVSGTSHSVALRTESSGSYTVGYCYNNAPALIMPTGCVWQPDGSLITMPKLPNLEMCVPSDLTDGGSQAFGYCSDRDYISMVPFAWSSSTNTISELQLPAGFARGTATSCTSDGGTITGYALDTTDLAVGCIWKPGQAVQTVGAYLASLGINTTGWSFGSCAISDTGTALIGTGLYNGVTTAWYVYLGPGCTAAPNITSQPISVTVNEGSPASFAVSANGGTLSYQWYKDTLMLSGQNSSILSLSSVAQADAGTYSCIVTNLCGSATSNGAVLTVNTTCPLPSILLQPVDTQGCVGSTITLETDAVNGDPVEYAWLHDGQDVAGAHSSTLTLSNLASSDAGIYVCRVINDCGDVLTNEVQVSVNDQCCDSIDFNNDTSLFDPQDIDAFLSVYSEGPCIPETATCNDIDFNNDGSLFDPCDIDAFLLQFSEGPCTLCGQ